MKNILIKTLGLLLIFTPLTVNAAEFIKWGSCPPWANPYQAAFSRLFFEKTGVRVNLTGGRMLIFRDLGTGKIDMANYCRPLVKEVKEEQGYKLRLFAWDAMTFIVNRNNPLDNITSEQAKGIYEGKITNWKELGGQDKPIRLLVRPHSLDKVVSGQGWLVRTKLFGNIWHEFTERAEMLMGTPPILPAVEKDPYAFAGMRLSDALSRDLKILNLNGVTPTKENIINNKYPFPAPVYLATNGEPKGSVKKLIELVLSDEGQEVIRQVGWINLREGKNIREYK
jgi:phosphate transport system substrate-binding protein